MIVFTLDIDGKEREFKVRVDSCEFTYSELIDFRLHEAKHFDAVSNGEPSQEHITNAVRQLQKETYLDELDFDNGTDDIYAMIKSGWMIDYNCDEITTSRMYVHFTSLIINYFRNEVKNVINLIDKSGVDDDSKAKIHEVKDYILSANDTASIANASLIFAELSGLIKLNTRSFGFMYKGHEYRIYANQVEKYFITRFKTGEVKEVLEFRRLCDLTLKERGDDDGMIAFQLGLRPLAIICRRKGEPLPKNEGERKLFLDQRMVHFQDIPLNIVYQVMFFFIHTCHLAVKTLYINSFMEGSSKRNQTALILQHGQGQRVLQRKEVKLSLVT